MTTKPQTATWNRDDRDLLVELRTQMAGIREEVSATRAEIKEINTGITARLLNLEGNAVNKVEFDDHEQRLTGLEDSRIEFRPASPPGASSEA